MLRSFDIRLMDGSKAGGIFPTFGAAEAEVGHIVQNLLTPLTRREIIHHFTLAWMRKEEQAKQLLAFRESLLQERWKNAARVFHQFSNYTREAIPGKVVLQINRNTLGQAGPIYRSSA